MTRNSAACLPPLFRTAPLQPLMKIKSTAWPRHASLLKDQIHGLLIHVRPDAELAVCSELVIAIYDDTGLPLFARLTFRIFL
jgi:hypothetical protein